MHVIEAAMIVCDTPEIQPMHLSADVRPTGSGPGAAAPAAGDGRLPTLEAVERAHIEAVLAAVDGHRGNAARILGISERNLYRKLRDYQLLP
jgi:DNA-binding NtrC family response regulator